MYAFQGEYFSQYSMRLLKSATAEVRGEKPDVILAVDQQTYIDQQYEKRKLDTLQIDWNQAAHTPSEVPTQHGKLQVFNFSVPVTGNIGLFHVQPSTYAIENIEIHLEGTNTLHFQILDTNNDANLVNERYEKFRQKLSNNAGTVNADVAKHNQTLRVELGEAYKMRYAEVERFRAVQQGIAIPLKQAKSPPQSFAAPAVRIKAAPAAAKVEVTKSKPQEQQYYLQQPIYDDILQTVFEFGKVLERYPGVYTGLEEEFLRDHLLLLLEPRYEGSATGETFNKGGKTDILMRYEKSNVFVAECKFWGGAKGHGETIDQLLKYLVWRDSKTAIISFVNNKDFSNTLETLKKATGDHPMCKKFMGEKKPGWLQFDFKLPTDPAGNIQVAVLAFHIPPK